MQNWENVINESDVNTAIENFIKQINSLINEPTTTISISAKIYKIKLWASTKIILLIRRRDHLHSQVRKYPDNTSLMQFYNNFRNKLTQLIRKAKTSYYQEEIFKAGHNYKRCWELINKASNRTKQKHMISYNKDKMVIL